MRSDITCAHNVYMQHYKQQWSTVQITACSVFPTYTHKLHCMEWWVQVHVYMYIDYTICKAVVYMYMCRCTCTLPIQFVKRLYACKFTVVLNTAELPFYYS